MLKRRILLSAAAAVAAIATVVVAVPGAEAATAAEKAAVLSQWTQPTTASRDAWLAASRNQGAWSGYQFNWSTNYCTMSPDVPMTFDFKQPCWRHDFGYINFRAAGTYKENKARVDNAFYADMKSVCAKRSIWVRPACYSLAWTYYQAVRAFGDNFPI